MTIKELSDILKPIYFNHKKTGDGNLFLELFGIKYADEINEIIKSQNKSLTAVAKEILEPLGINSSGELIRAVKLAPFVELKNNQII